MKKRSAKAPVTTKRSYVRRNGETTLGRLEPGQCGKLLKGAGGFPKDFIITLVDVPKPGRPFKRHEENYLKVMPHAGGQIVRCCPKTPVVAMRYAEITNN